MNSENVKYINLGALLPVIEGAVSDQDFKDLVDSLIEKHNVGSLEFITVSENSEPSMFSHYIIKVASNEEPNNYLATLNKKRENKGLSLILTSCKTSS